MNPTSDSFKTLAAWLAALFLTALGAQLWIVWLYGSPLPLWDQWYEADFFKSGLAGQLKFTDFFAAHNEHRIFATRLLDVGLIWLNGRWEPLLQMTVNAAIHAAFACGLAYCLWDFLGRKNGWLVCLLLVPFFALPYAGENAIWGFNSQDYFVNIFMLAALAGLGFGKPGSVSWWIGLAAAVLGLFNMASGLLAPVAVEGLLILRWIKNRRLASTELLTLIVCILVVILGAALNVTKEQDRAFQAHTFLEFTAALARNLSWPFYNAPFMPGLIGLPLALLLAFYLRPNFSQPRAAEFLLALALWSALQSVAMAYGRANYGGATFPVSRYMDWFNVFVIAAAFAAVLLAQLWGPHRFRNSLLALVYLTAIFWICRISLNWFNIFVIAAVFAAVLLAQLWGPHRFRNGLLALVYLAMIFIGMCRISPIVVDGLLTPSRMMTLVAEERVQRFMANGSESDFLQNPTVPPDPHLTLTVLRDPQLQTILPAICQPPSPAPKTGRLAALTQWLLENSVAILAAGLGLFIGLGIYGCARGTLGITPKNPAAILAVLAVLAALGFVGSKHAVTRQSVEYQLQLQIADKFKAAGNLPRAAIHQQKADELKQFAN